MQTTDSSIAKQVQLQPIRAILEDSVGLRETEYITFGQYKAKVDFEKVAARSRTDNSRGKIVLVTGVSPTAAGEGKTTTTIGLTDALNNIGVRAAAALREPSLGPCFGVKGGAHGGGWSQVAPSEEINLHFNGDVHAITTANNLLASIIDNHIYWGNSLGIDPQGLMFLRAMDLNERSLRRLNVKSRRDTFLKTGFNITAASEIMAIFCLASDLSDLQRRLGNIVVARSKTGDLVTARDLEIDGALTVLLRDALNPNLVQTLEQRPVFVHGGPFANIAHGCNSIIATRTAQELFDVVVTEAGFGADLGAEKFINIKCRQAGFMPDAVVIVATIRSIKMHGGVSLDKLFQPDVEAVGDGITNLATHVENMIKMGFVPIVALNRFDTDTDEERTRVVETMRSLGVQCIPSNHWKLGGRGAEELADSVIACIEKDDCSNGKLLYSLDKPLAEKISIIAQQIYRAAQVDLLPEAIESIKVLEDQGFGQLPVCIAKTQCSFSAYPDRLGAPIDHILPVREVRLSAGAEFVVVICGDIMTMPGLPKVPAANQIHIASDGAIEGIF